MLFNENSRFKPYGHVLRPFAHCLPTSRHILAKMTGGLNVLYQQMRKSKRPTPADFNLCTDKNGNFHPTEDMPLLAGRYKFTQVIGVGQSSIVLKAKDTFQDGRAVAVKVLKVKYSILGAQEAGCLINLNSSDPHRFAPILQLLNTFRLGQHYCMVFELLHPTSLIKLFAEKPTAQEKLRCIRKVAFRLLSAVGFLQSRKIIHADLKPDNLLLSREKKLNSLKIVDFGNAFHCVHDELSLYYDDFELQTLVYRAPEVFFGMMFGVEVDMWSIGCILAELYTGTPLFYGPNLESILMKMHTLLGPIPQEIFQRGKFYRKLEKFTKCNVKPLDVTSVMQCLNCSDFLFTDFLVRLLKYDPASRMTVTDAAEHPFLASELGIKYFNLRKVYNTVPSYPKIFLTEDVNRYSPREVNRGSSLVEETSSLQLETSKFPDILKITLTEKIIKNDDLSDYKRRSISSELKSGSCSSEVNAKPKSSGKLKAIRALSSSSSKIESNEADNSSNMPTRLVPASEKNGQVTVERMEPERRTRVQRSDDVIFSQMGKQERNCDEGLSNFHTCEEHRSILSCSEANIIQRPTKTTSPSTEELRVSSDDERKRPRSAQDSASAVDVSDRRDRNTQKQNLRELKSLLSKILASPPLHSSTSNGDDDDDDDKNQHLRNGSKTDLNTTFVKPSLAHNLISEEELPGVCDGDSMNPSILPSKKIVVDMNFASDGSKEVARSLKPNSATLGKASSVTGHSNNNLLSGFFKVQSNIPDLPETTGQICNSLSERKTELSARRSDNHTGEKTTREDELCTLSQKMSPSHLEEKVPDENHLKLHRSSVVTGSKCLKSSDQRSIPNAGGNWSLTPKSIPVVAGYNTPHKKQCHEKSSLDTTFVVERRSNGRPSFATPVAISDTRRQPSKTMKATAKSPSCVEPPVKPVFSSDENKTSSKPEINVKRNSGGEESNGDQQLCCGDGFGKAFEKFQDLEMGFANHEPRKLEKRSRNQTSPLVTENDFPPEKRLKVNSDQNSSGLHKPSVRSIFTSPRDVSVSSESKGSDNSHGKWKVSPDRNSDGRQNCRSGRRGRDLNETFMVLKNQVQNKPGRNLSGHLSSSSSSLRDSRALERPPKRRFDDLRVEDFDEVGSEFVRRRRNLSNHVVASDEESVESDDSTKSGYTLDASSSAKRSRLALSISTESCLHHSEDGNDDALIALTP